MRVILKGVLICLVGLAIVSFPRASHFRKHTGRAGVVAVSAEARYFVSVDDDETVRIWNADARKELSVLAQKSRQIRSVVFSPDCKMIAGGDDKHNVIVWAVADGKELFRFRGHTREVVTITFSPDCKMLVSGSTDQTVKIWDLETLKEALTIQSGYDFLASVAFHPDGKLFASGGQTGDGNEIQLRDVKTGKVHLSWKEPRGPIRRVGFSPDGKVLYSANSKLSLWDVATGRQRDCECPEWFEDGELLHALAFSPDSRTLVAGHDVAIGLWDVASGKNTRAFGDRGPNPYLSFADRFLLDPKEQRFPFLAAAAFKPNGDLMVLGVRGETVALWRLTSVPQKK